MKTESEKDHPEYVQHDECPHCLRLLNCATVIESKPARPSVGDYSVCIGCAALLRFDERLVLRATDESDMDDLGPDGRLRVAAAQAIIRQRKWPELTRGVWAERAPKSK